MKLIEKLIILLFLSSTLASCAKTDAQAIKAAINEANYHLTSMDCVSAKAALDGVDFQAGNASYISTYASAQACVGNYNELDLFAELGDISAAGFLESFAALSSANETAADSTTYAALKAAITTLLAYDGATNPSTATRNAKFGDAKSGDLSMQAMYLIMLQIGKYFALYANTDTNGVKGAGTFSNSCIFSYTETDSVNIITTLTPGSCSGATGSEGSDFLESPVTAAAIKTRLCEGVILYTNFTDILSNITLPGSSELGAIADIKAVFDLAYSSAEAAEAGYVANSTDAIATLRVIREQALCEAADLNRISKWFALLMESQFTTT